MLFQKISNLPAITPTNDHNIKIELLNKIKCYQHLSYCVAMHIKFLALIKQTFYCFKLQVCFFMCAFGKICFGLCKERFQFFYLIQTFFYRISCISLLRTKTATTTATKSSK